MSLSDCLEYRECFCSNNGFPVNAPATPRARQALLLMNKKK